MYQIPTPLGCQSCQWKVSGCRLSFGLQCPGSRNQVNTVNLQSRFAMDKEIFMFERHTYTEMTYSLPVRNGHNTLILKFAEVYMSIINIDVLPEIWTEGVQYQNWWDHCCGKYGCFRQNWSKICRTLRVYRDRG